MQIYFKAENAFTASEEKQRFRREIEETLVNHNRARWAARRGCIYCCVLYVLFHCRFLAALSDGDNAVNAVSTRANAIRSCT